MFRESIREISVIILFYLMVFLSAAQELPQDIHDNINIKNFSQSQILQNSLIESTNLQISQSNNLHQSNLLINENPLEGENILMLKEFKDIMRLYNKLPISNAERINLFRRLLARLNQLEPITDFLQGQRDIMRASLRYRLGIRGLAIKGLEDLIKNSPCMAIREESAKIFVSYALMNHEMTNIQEFSQKYASYLSPEINIYLDIIGRIPNNISKEEATLILNKIIQAPVGAYYNQDAYTRLLSKIINYLESDDLDKTITSFLLDKRLTAVIPIIKLRLNLTPVTFDTLLLWGEQLKDREKFLVQLLKLTKNKSEDYQKYIDYYQQRHNAQSRGRVYNVRLYRYRGLNNSPYNSYYAEKVFKDYLKGEIEEKFININTEYAFRNFLAFKKYDKIIQYATIIHEKMPSGFISPYINFWHSYALLELGNTNAAIPLLGDIIAKDPESYFGIIAQNTMKDIFRVIPFSRLQYLNTLENQATNRISILKYAYNLYYLGTLIDKSRSEKIFRSMQRIHSKSQTKISPKIQALMEAYLYLGLEKNARVLMYHDGVTNPYFQDIIFNKYFTKNNYTKNNQYLISKREQLMEDIKTFMIEKSALKIYYPKPYQDSLIKASKKINTKIDLNLIYAVMRTESFYKIKAKSHANAKGLMQIMPITGKWLINKYLPKLNSYSLYDTDINIYLGSVYLYDNIEAMGILPALAAYNSGPTYVKQLIRRYKPKTNLELIEIHPKKETRLYVKKVIESYQRYKQVYENDSLNISQII